MPLPELVAQLNAEFGRGRTTVAVIAKANGSGLSVEYLEGMTMQQLARIVGWDGHAETRRGHYGTLIVRHWVEPDLLKARKIRGKGRDGRWQIMEADFERFLVEHPYAYDWRRFTPGPWRAKAELIARRSVWRSLDDLMTYLGIQHRNCWWRRWREIPHKRRHHRLGGSYHTLGEPMIDARVFPEIKERLDLTRFTPVGSRRRRSPPRWRRTCRGCGARIIGRPDESPPGRCAFCGTSIRRTGDPPLLDDRRSRAA